MGRMNKALETQLKQNLESLFKEKELRLQWSSNQLENKLVAYAILDWPSKTEEVLRQQYDPFLKELRSRDDVAGVDYSWVTSGALAIGLLVNSMY